MRGETETKTLWIDALCINQEDEVEKETQILLMGDIYQKCASCWIWLGETNSKTQSDAVEEILKSWASNEHLYININFDGRFVRVVTDLTRRKWFSRIWTVQESILPKELIIFYGSRRIPWTVFEKAAKNVRRHLTDSSRCCSSHNDTANPYMKDVNDFLHAILTISRSRKILHGKQSQNSDSWRSEILTCLHNYRNRNATQAQDKIFGLYGLVDSKGREIVKLGLGLSAEEAYITLCMEHINKTGSLQVLQYVLWSTEPSKLAKPLPTWVPDWTLAIPEPRYQKFRIDRYSIYKANGGRKSQPKFDLAAGTMADYGVCCGVVAKVGSGRLAEWSEDLTRGGNKKRSWSSGFGKKKEKGQSIPKDWVRIADLASFKDKLKARTDFWRTLIMDTIGESADPSITSLRKALDGDYKQYEKLLTKVMKGTGWPADTDRIYLALETATLLRRFFVIDDGQFGIGPARMREKDMIYIMKGGRCPLVLRSSGQNGRYSFIGDCFLVGVMWAEAAAKLDSSAAEMICI
jgi:hypothetical protein